MHRRSAPALDLGTGRTSSTTCCRRLGGIQTRRLTVLRRTTPPARESWCGARQDLGSVHRLTRREHEHAPPQDSHRAARRHRRDRHRPGRQRQRLRYRLRRRAGRDADRRPPSPAAPTTTRSTAAGRPKARRSPAWAATTRSPARTSPTRSAAATATTRSPAAPATTPRRRPGHRHDLRQRRRRHARRPLQRRQPGQPRRRRLGIDTCQGPAPDPDIHANCENTLSPPVTRSGLGRPRTAASSARPAAGCSSTCPRWTTAACSSACRSRSSGARRPAADLHGRRRDVPQRDVAAVHLRPAVSAASRSTRASTEHRIGGAARTERPLRSF